MQFESNITFEGEETTTYPAKAIRLTDPTRAFFADIMPEPIPDDAAILLWSKEGYQFLTQAEWDEAPDQPVEPGYIRLNLPHMMMFSYYDATYQS